MFTCTWWVCTRTLCNSIRTESLCSSNQRRRHRGNLGRSKGCGWTESRPIPKQAFAGSNPVTRSNSQEQAYPASDGRPDSLKLTYLAGKHPRVRTLSPAPPPCFDLNLAHDATSRSVNHARKSLY